MSYPTGMGANTGMHYQNVAAQMQSFMNPTPQRYDHSYGGGGFAGNSMGPAIASQAFRYGAQRIGFNPVVVNNFSGFARSFVRNVLS
jgi:hypothetical protein